MGTKLYNIAGFLIPISKINGILYLKSTFFTTWVGAIQQ